MALEGNSPSAGPAELRVPPTTLGAMASQGDIRVLLVLDIVLSFVFSLMVVSGLSYVGLATFTWPNVGVATAALALITYLAVLRK